MLDSRYIHLHEALGLGAMWLNAGAKIIPPPAAQPAPDRQPETAPERSISAHARQARLTALNRVRSSPPAAADSGASAPQPQDTPAFRQPETPTAAAPHTAVKVMVLSVCASPADVAAGRLFSGSDGALLHKMLAAIGLEPQQVHIGTWLKTLPDFNPSPPADTVAAATAAVAREWQDSRAAALLLLGHFFERADVQHELNRFSQPQQRFHIHHPMRIQRDPTLKRSAWNTLQQLQQLVQAA